MPRILRRLGRQTWPADLAGRLGRQTWPADLAGRLGWQTWPADLASRLGRQTWPADLACQTWPSDFENWKPTLFHVKTDSKSESSPWTARFKRYRRRQCQGTDLFKLCNILQVFKSFYEFTSYDRNYFSNYCFGSQKCRAQQKFDPTMYVKQCDCLKPCLWTTTFVDDRTSLIH
jgi:hypothetical protein